MTACLLKAETEAFAVAEAETRKRNTEAEVRIICTFTIGSRFLLGTLFSIFGVQHILFWGLVIKQIFVRNNRGHYCAVHFSDALGIWLRIIFLSFGIS